MRITEHFKLGLKQREVDFVDIDYSRDTPLFVDPIAIASRGDSWSRSASETLNSYFSYLFSLIQNGNITRAQSIFTGFGEPNETKLGVSSGKPRGRGVGSTLTTLIFDNFLKSKAAKSGLIEHIEDFHLFVEKFGPDMLSDMTTNIIKSNLINFTLEQAKIYGFTVERNKPTGTWWNFETNSWAHSLTDMLVVENEPIVLVPKWSVIYNLHYTPTTFYKDFMVEFIRSEQLRINGALVTIQKNGVRRVYNKDIEKKHPYSKDNLAEFAMRHTIDFQQYRKSAKLKNVPSFDLVEQTTTGSADPIDLATRLTNIPPGTKSATDYQKCILSIWNYLFVGQLVHGKLEEWYEGGHKRLDIVHDNISKRGFFHWICDKVGLKAPFIITECKNYTGTISNPEFDQLSGRLYDKNALGFITLRVHHNYISNIRRSAYNYLKKNVLILPITDDIILKTLRHQDPALYINSRLINIVRQIYLS